MKRYTHIFFDLDRTLWDFEKNSAETLAELYTSYRLEELGVNHDEFVETYCSHVDRMWSEYSRELVTKDQLRLDRFIRTLASLGITNPELAAAMAADYTATCPHKPALVPEALEVLEYLTRQYKLVILSNGFKDVQHLKLKAGGIHDFFCEIITSEHAGHRKPSEAIFRYALKQSGAEAVNSLMVGDHYEIDILGARGAGLDQVYYNPAGLKVSTLPTYQVRRLGELMQIL